MGFVGRLLTSFRNEASVPFVPDNIPPEAWRFFGASTASGISMSPETAMRCATVFSCVRVVSEDVGKLPFILYRRLKNGGKERAVDHPAYWLLQGAPNGWQTPMEFMSQSQGNLELSGYAPAYVNRYRGEVRELIPLPPRKVKVSQASDWKVTYDYDRGQYSNEDMLYLRHLSIDGIHGLSTIGYARESIGLALAAQTHGARLFKNGARPGGFLKLTKALSDDAQRRLKESFEAAHSGENAYRVGVLEEGTDWETAGMTGEDLQFVEGRQFERTELAGMFRVPPHKIGDLSRSTNNNIEHQALEYVGDSLLGRTTRIQQRLNRTLLNERERKEFFFECLLDALLRGDTKTRYEAHASAINAGWKSRNEVRVQENMNPEDGLDEFLSPLNMRRESAPPTGAAE